MRLSRTRLLWATVALSFVGAVSSWGAEVTLEGIVSPQFDAAGNLIRKLTAERGSAFGDLRRLEQVHVQYFAPGDSSHPVETVTAANALWDVKKQTLSGDGPVAVNTETSALSGVGFDFAMETSVLVIRSAFRMSNPDFVLTGDHATADLLVQKTGRQLKYRDVRRCTAAGNLHLVATPGHRGKIPFDTATTDLAIYDGEVRTVTLPHEVHVIDGTAQGTTRSAIIQL